MAKQKTMDFTVQLVHSRFFGDTRPTKKEIIATFVGIKAKTLNEASEKLRRQLLNDPRYADGVKYGDYNYVTFLTGRENDPIAARMWEPRRTMLPYVIVKGNE